MFCASGRVGRTLEIVNRAIGLRDFPGNQLPGSNKRIRVCHPAFLQGILCPGSYQWYSTYALPSFMAAAMYSCFLYPRRYWSSP